MQHKFPTHPHHVLPGSGIASAETIAEWSQLVPLRVVVLFRDGCLNFRECRSQTIPTRQKYSESAGKKNAGKVFEVPRHHRILLMHFKFQEVEEYCKKSVQS